MTRSPGANPETPGPTSAIVPATSRPRISESPGGGGYFPSRCTRSGRLTLVATTFTSTCPSPGRGRSASPTFRTSTPPKPLSRTAFIVRLLQEGIRGSAHVRTLAGVPVGFRPPRRGGAAPLLDRGASGGTAPPPPSPRMSPAARLLGVFPAALLACGHGAPSRQADALARERDELSALWSLYRYTHVQDGRVVATDEGGITTSEGQAYALLRAVWANDRRAFDDVWGWTKEHLQVREDRLLAWKWKDRVLDRNAATDADQDAALALILASRRFGEPRFLDEARGLLRDMWEKEVVVAGGRPFPTGGNWAPAEAHPTVHVAYLAPYAYEVFAGVDPARPWKDLVRSSYDLLRFLYVERGLALPPEVVYLDPRTGAILLERPGGSGPSPSGYDAVPVFWRVALDARWFGRRGEADLRARMLRFPREAWRAEGRLRDRATTAGRALSPLDGLPLLEIG